MGVLFAGAEKRILAFSGAPRSTIDNCRLCQEATVFLSEEGYKSKSSVMNGIKSVSVNAEIVGKSLEK